MTEEKKKGKKIYFIVFMVFVLILLGVLYYFVFYKKDEVKIDSEEESITEEVKSEEEIDISDWKTYKNEEYGYSLRYPAFYSENSSYNTWVTKNNEISLLGEWGVNKKQETIFTISIYPEEKEKFVIDYYNYTITNEKIELRNELLAKKLSKGSSNSEMLIRKNEYIYIISSTFMFLNDVPEHKEYITILESLEIK